MAAETRTLLLSLLMAGAIYGQNLHLSMDRTPSTDFCARLECVADLRDDTNSTLSIIGLRIYKITLAKKRLFKLASMSLLDPSPHLDLARGHAVNATGRVSRFHGDLMLEFQDESDCLYGSFLCELNFVNSSGQPVVVKEVATPERENLNSILLSKMAASIETLSSNVAKEHNLFSNQTASMEATLDGLLSNQTAGMEAKLDGLFSNLTASMEPKLDGLFSNQTAGMEAKLDGLFSNQTAGMEAKLEGLFSYQTASMEAKLDSLLSNQTAGMEAKLDSLLSNQTASMEATLDSLLSNQTANMEAKLDSLLSNQTAGMEAKLDSLLLRMQTLEELRNESYEIPQLARCYKGMSKRVARLKITLWNNVEALCDAHTDGGGWIIFQRRTSGEVSFYRNWTEYREGFGTTDTEYWLGNDLISNLTSLGYNELRVDLKKGQKRYVAHYSDFSVADATLNYQLTVSGYSGTAGDALEYHNNMYFSTYDKDNDVDTGNCASYWTGAWWYRNCHHSNLNGLFGAQNYSGINWSPVIKETSADFSEMKIRQG